MKWRAIVPAAGKGTRLHSGDNPKAMHLICGRPLLEVALENINFIAPDDVYIVVGYQKQKITDYFGAAYHYVEQKQQLGTGDAVAACTEAFRGYDGNVIVVFGDMPMYHRDALQNLCRAHEESGADCTIMTAVNDELPDWGKIIRNKDGSFYGIIEAVDCTPEQAKTNELFSGVMVFRSESLFRVLPKLSSDNQQSEYYLTEVPQIMMAEKMKVDMFAIPDGDDIRGVNTPEDLAICEAILNRRAGK